MPEMLFYKCHDHKAVIALPMQITPTVPKPKLVLLCLHLHWPCCA